MIGVFGVVGGAGFYPSTHLVVPAPRSIRFPQVANVLGSQPFARSLGLHALRRTDILTLQHGAVLPQQVKV